MGIITERLASTGSCGAAKFDSQRQLAKHVKDQGHGLKGRAQAAIQLAAKRNAQGAAPTAAQEAAPTAAQGAAPTAAQEAAPAAAPTATQGAAPTAAQGAAPIAAPTAAQGAAPTAAQGAAPTTEPQGTGDSSEEGDLEDCQVVGVRRSGDQFERFLWWTEHGKDECTYEPTANTIDLEFLCSSNIQIHYLDGTSIDARVVSCRPDSDSTGNDPAVFLLERYGATARHLPRGRDNRQLELNLVAWDAPNIVGWNALGCTEWDPLAL